MTREGAEWALGVGVGGSLLAGGDVGRVVQEVFELDEVAGSQRRVLHTPPPEPPRQVTPAHTKYRAVMLMCVSGGAHRVQDVHERRRVGVAEAV